MKKDVIYLGAIIDKYLLSLYSHYIVSESYVMIEYRKYVDEDRKIIKTFNHPYQCILYRKPGTEWDTKSDLVVFIDPFFKKVFTFTLLEQDMNYLNEEDTIFLLLIYINPICDFLIPVYENDKDEVIHFKVDNTYISDKSLNGWRPIVAKQYGLSYEQTHDIILKNDLSDSDIKTLTELDEMPDYRIIRSQYEDITLIRPR